MLKRNPIIGHVFQRVYLQYCVPGGRIFGQNKGFYLINYAGLGAT